MPIRILPLSPFLALTSKHLFFSTFPHRHLTFSTSHPFSSFFNFPNNLLAPSNFLFFRMAGSLLCRVVEYAKMRHVSHGGVFRTQSGRIHKFPGNMTSNDCRKLGAATTLKND